MNSYSSLRAQRSNPVWIAASRFALLAMTVSLTACDLSPDFTPPAIEAPTNYKSEESSPGLWQEAVPYEKIERGEWWKIFDDEVLNTLEKDAAANSPTLAIAAERVAQARAAAGTARAELFPEIDAGFSPRREKFSAGSPNLPPGLTTKPQTSFSAQGILSWELDLFGRISGQHKAAELNAEAQESLYQSALLSLQADVAQLYYSIRIADANRALLHQTLVSREESLRIAKRLQELGETNILDQSRAEAEYATTKAALLALDRQRGELENALAVLIGAVPSSYELPPIPLSDREPPVIPAGIPSTLLSRRPDISAAIRQMEAANRMIGVARAAMFPRIALTAIGGYESPDLDNLFDWSNRFWVVGPGAASVVTQPIFEGGRVFYEIDRFESVRGEAVATYRQQALVAFKEVEDSLNAIRLLREESQQQAIASQAAINAERLSAKLYQLGDISYVNSLDAQRTSLATQRGFVEAQGARWIATITLVRALGGSWEQKLPEPPSPLTEEGIPHETTPNDSPVDGADSQ